MISENSAKAYCCEDISLIENYEQAVNDKTTTWHCHHRLGSSMTSSGPFYTAEELILNNKYFNRPANELVFLTPHDHLRCHGRPLKNKKKKLKHKDILKIASRCIAAGYSESQTLEIISQL